MKNRITLFFQPEDVLLFRDARPFDMGQHVLARSVFPQPTVFRGAVRTALFRQLGADFGKRDEHFGLELDWAKEVLGGKSAPGRLTLRGPVAAELIRDKETNQEKARPFFHPPLDLVETRNHDRDEKAPRKKWRILRPRKFSDLEESVRFSRWHRLPNNDLELIREGLPWTDRVICKESGGRLLLTAEESRAYLDGDADGLPRKTEMTKEENVFKIEERVGIGRDQDTRTAKEGMFYKTLCYRFHRDLEKCCGFAVEVDVAESVRPENQELLAAELTRLDSRLVPLGGKRHFASIRVLESPLFDLGLADSEEYGNGNRVKLWLQTPALSLPGKEHLPSGSRIAGKVTGRPVFVSGFDLANRSPRELKRALPPGTVVWLEGISPQAALDALIGAHDESDRRAGYGTALAGRW